MAIWAGSCFAAKFPAHPSPARFIGDRDSVPRAATKRQPLISRPAILPL